MDTPDLSHLLLNWPVEPALNIRALTGGTNNQTWLVETEGGSSYVLRLTSGASDLPHFRYETALLMALRNKPLAFHLPYPLQTRDGDILKLVEWEQREPAIATLTAFFPGQIPERNRANSISAGVALAQLDVALATIPDAALPADSGAAHFLYGDLFHCHPLVAEPFTTVERLLKPDQSRPLCAILAQSQQDWEMLSLQMLPQQVLHRDYGPGNVLMEQGQVIAILDFEFAGVDKRIFDLCVALSWWPVRLMGTGQEWDLIDAFGRAYTTCFPLTGEELLALPAALRMRDTTALLYRIGRYLAGLETEKTLQERVQHSFWREAWLLTNREILLQHIMAWQR